MPIFLPEDQSFSSLRISPRQPRCAVFFSPMFSFLWAVQNAPNGPEMTAAGSSCSVCQSRYTKNRHGPFFHGSCLLRLSYEELPIRAAAKDFPLPQSILISVVWGCASSWASSPVSSSMSKEAPQLGQTSSRLSRVSSSTVVTKLQLGQVTS